MIYVVGIFGLAMVAVGVVKIVRALRSLRALWLEERARFACSNCGRDTRTSACRCRVVA